MVDPTSPNPESSEPKPADPTPADPSPADPTPASSNRREFLQGQRTRDGLNRAPADSAPEHQAHPKSVPLPPIASRARDRQAAYLEQYSKNAMACEFQWLFNLHQYPQSGVSALTAFELIDQIESQMSVYRPDSELSQINRTADQRETSVESELFQLLLLAQEIHRATGGAFDITSDTLTKLWGFDRRAGNLPEPDAIAEALNCVGSNYVDLDREQQTIRITKPGVRLNLGGIGKGHALDRVAHQFQANGIFDFAIHGGNSSVLASGVSIDANERDDSTRGWPIGITHPTLPGKRLGEFTLRNQALGTSGTGRQGFYHQGKRFGHIIDPRSGWPTNHFLSTTVVSNSAAVSDALATAFFVMPFEDIERYCDQHPDVTALLVKPAPRTKSQVELICLNLNEAQWKLGF